MRKLIILLMLLGTILLVGCHQGLPPIDEFEYECYLQQDNLFVNGYLLQAFYLFLKLHALNLPF